jgi:hypothetical protein
MRRALRWIVCSLAFLFLAYAANLAALHWRHYRDFGYLAPLGLHADQPRGDGLVLGNFGVLPRRVRLCHALSDTAEPVSMIEWEVQERRGDPRIWHPLWKLDTGGICKAFPTSHGDGEIRKDWLAPGQTLRFPEVTPVSRGEILEDRPLRIVVYIGDGETIVAGRDLPGRR